VRERFDSSECHLSVPPTSPPLPVSLQIVQPSRRTHQKRLPNHRTRFSHLFPPNYLQPRTTRYSYPQFCEYLPADSSIQDNGLTILYHHIYPPLPTTSRLFSLNPRPRQSETLDFYSSRLPIRLSIESTIAVNMFSRVSLRTVVPRALPRVQPARTFLTSLPRRSDVEPTVLGTFSSLWLPKLGA
jgi:hypothetical protein